MPRKRYDPKTKAAIFEAVKATRAGGKSWKDTHEAAKKAGYNGSEQSLKKMIYTAPRRGRKRGKRVPAPKLTATAKTAVKAPAELQTIQTAVDSLVRQRVNAILDRLLAHIQKAKV